MATNGDVNLTITDFSAAAISLPANQVQVVMGCCQTGTENVVVATRQPQTLLDEFGYGPLIEAGGLVLAAGGTVLAMLLPTTTAGAVAKKDTGTVSTVTNANPAVVTTSAPHGLITGDVVTIASVVGSTGVNGTWIVTKTGASTFSVPVAAGGVYVSGGTVTPLGAIVTNAAATVGTAEIYFTGTALDQYYLEVTIITGGAVGTATIQFTVSLDAGRSKNLPRITLDTSADTTYEIPHTGITINFGTGTLVAGDTARGYTTPPLPSASDVVAGLEALMASPYAQSGWGSMHLVGAFDGADAQTIADELDVFEANKLYDRLMGETVDASPPTAWGGTGESDSTWSTALIADYSTTVSTRMGVSAGYYNIRSPYPNPVAGLPFYRRPLAWAWASRVTALPVPADHEGWVSLGGLRQITLNVTSDPKDGFVYHDEQATGPVFDNLAGGPGRMTAARLRRNKAGWFIANPLSLAEPGSDYQLMPRGRVMDLASDIIQQVGVNYVNARVKLNPNGTIREIDAGALETVLYAGIDNGIGNQISGRTIVVDRTWNVQATNTVKIAATIQGDAFALEIDVTLGYGQPQ